MSPFWSSIVHTLSPYVPGEQPKQDGLIKLNTNENPYPPSPRVVPAIVAATERLRLYPDPHASHLRAAIAARLRDQGVLVRHFRKPRIEDFLRITVGTDDDCGRLVALLRRLV